MVGVGVSLLRGHRCCIRIHGTAPGILPEVIEPVHIVGMRACIGVRTTTATTTATTTVATTATTAAAAVTTVAVLRRVLMRVLLHGGTQRPDDIIESCRPKAFLQDVVRRGLVVPHEHLERELHFFLAEHHARRITCLTCITYTGSVVLLVRLLPRAALGWWWCW